MLIKQGRFDVIDHKFPEPGHSFMDSDRDFGHVEQAVKQHENIYSVDEYEDIISSCVRKSKFSICCMNNKFCDMTALPDLLKLKNLMKNRQ